MDPCAMICASIRPRQILVRIGIGL